jgi:TonB family protein
MQGYVAIKKKKSRLGKTLTIVAVLHLIVGGGMIWLAKTSKGRELMNIYKLTLRNIYEPPPPPPPKPPEPEPPPKEEEPPPPPPEPVKEAAVEPPPVTPPPLPPTGESPQELKLPGFGSPFGGGKKGKFGAYADLVTVEIQRLYKQPADLPDDSNMTVQLQLILEEDGSVTHYKLLRSSGNEKFDQSALQAVGKLQKLRPPPAGMSKTLVVKFFHKIYNS